MKHVFAALVLVAAVLTAGGILASGVVRGAMSGDMTKPPMPCLDTTGDSTMLIQLAGDKATQLQQVYGMITSWDSKTTTIGFKSDVTQKLEHIPIGAVHFKPSKRNSIANSSAQAATPILEPLGDISRRYLASEVGIDKGILKLPECRLDKQLAFEGSLTFSSKDVLIEGQVFKIVPPAGGTGDSTTFKGG